MAGSNRIKDFPSATPPLGALDYFAVDSAQDGARKVPATQLSRVLFKWNGTDATQFDTPVLVRSAGSTPVPSVSVVASAADPNKNVLKLIATGQIDNTRVGIVLLPVKTTELALGSGRRYVVRMKIAQRNTGSGADYRGVGIAYLVGKSGADYYAHCAFCVDDSQVGSSSATACRLARMDGTAVAVGSATPTGPNMTALGFIVETEVVGKDGSPPEYKIFQRAYSSAVLGHLIKDQAVGASGWNISAAPAGWNGLALDRVGIGMVIGGNGAAIVDAYYEIEEFVVFKHPMDE